MKHLSVIISVLFSILCIGCSKEDFNDGKTNDVQNKHSLRLLVYTPTSETVLSTDLPEKHRGLSVQRGSSGPTFTKI